MATKTTSHTPGPWNCDLGIGRFTRYVRAKNHTIVCVGHARAREEINRVDADACLIAAAPDMLAVLRLIEHGVSEHFAWMPDIRATIAKAEGR